MRVALRVRPLISKEMNEKQIARLVGSTTPTVISIKNRTHWDMPNITPKDPVLLGICSRVDLENQLAIAKIAAEKQDA